ncbi:unnamed protein product [Moneuplotes crassus]|uniref:Uncharacterized protein n=1 Tax=Euplotes crassus TaxID=5936 RepID=A0AAD1UQ14_EUPCR|nr:unnamed protein product [Moneuplotes crassus]
MDHSSKKPPYSLSEAISDSLVSFLPSSLTCLVEYSMSILNLAFVGMLGDVLLLSGLGLGSVTVNICIFSIDFCGGLDTLVSQAFGRRNYTLCSVYYRTSMIVAIIFFIPQMLICINYKAIFQILGQPEESAEIAGIYIIYILPGCLVFKLFDCTRRHLSACGVYSPSLFITIITMVIHLVNLYLFVYLLGYRMKAVAIITDITFLLNFVLLSANTSRARIQWISCFDLAPFKKIYEYLYYGIPSCFMLLIEWWVYEMLIIFSGWLGVAELATSIVVLNLYNTIYSFSLGLQYAAICLIGNSIGEGDLLKAQTSILALFICSFMTIVMIVATCMIFKENIILLFTDDQRIVENFCKVFTMFLICSGIQMVQGTSIGIIKAAGYQIKATLVNLFILWGIKIPLVYYFTFVQSKSYFGIWEGTALGNIILMGCYFMLILGVPWRELIEANYLQLNRRLELSENLL